MLFLSINFSLEKIFVRFPPFVNLLFSLTLQAVRKKNQGAPPLGVAKSIYYTKVTSPSETICSSLV